MGKKYYLIFFVFLAPALIIYWPARQAGFVMDFLAWQEKFDQLPLTAAFTNFGYHAQQQFFLLLFYSAYKLFALHGIYWFFLFAILHALNGWLLFRLFTRIFERMAVKNSFLVALTGSLFFILSPYNAEVIIWKVCMHYLMTATFVLLILHATISFYETGKSIFAAFPTLCFFLALFTFELSIVIPIALLAFTIFWFFAVGRENWLKRTLLLILPQVVLLPFYFLLDQWMFGSLVGHYGAGVHLNFSFFTAGGNAIKYMVKYLFFLRYFPFHTKEPVFAFFNKEIVVLVAASIFVVTLAVILLRKKRVPPVYQIGMLCLFLFLILLLPTLNLYMSTMLLSENDRYGYIPSMFFFMGLSLLLFSLPRLIYFLMVPVYLVISIWLLTDTTRVWTEANKVYEGLINDFRWYGKKQVYILNIPDNYQGVWMFRIFNEPSALPECLELIRHKTFDGEIRDIAQFNMMTPEAGVSVTSDSSGKINVKWNQWGNWWWRNGAGAADYKTDAYAVHFTGDGYELHFKNIDTTSAVIYQTGDRWNEFKWP